MPGLSVQILNRGGGDHGHRWSVVLSEFGVAQGGAEDGGQGVVLALGVAASIPPAASGGASPSVSGVLVCGLHMPGAAYLASSASIMARCSGVAISVPVLMPSGR